MKVKELVLDGFKSYPVRTSISGWDPSFNAITGLSVSSLSLFPPLVDTDYKQQQEWIRQIKHPRRVLFRSRSNKHVYGQSSLSPIPSLYSHFAPPQTNQVRASNLIDLIYKRGQAGVTRASVTIYFDNSDKATAPVGFENLPEISVTRQVCSSLAFAWREGEGGEI